jgi:hypothetical protein
VGIRGRKSDIFALNHGASRVQVTVTWLSRVLLINGNNFHKIGILVYIKLALPSDTA